jgi:hypothetical protein
MGVEVGLHFFTFALFSVRILLAAAMGVKS